MHLWGFSNGGKKRKKKRKISAHADGGPRSRICARETLRSAPHQHERKFSPHVSAESPSNISPNWEPISKVSEDFKKSKQKSKNLKIGPSGGQHAGPSGVQPGPLLATLPGEPNTAKSTGQPSGAEADPVDVSFDGEQSPSLEGLPSSQDRVLGLVSARASAPSFPQQEEEDVFAFGFSLDWRLYR